MADESWQEWLPKIAAFHAEVLKTSGSGGGNYLFKMHSGVRYGLTADLSLLGVSVEDAVTADALTLDLEVSEPEPEFEDEPDLEELQEQREFGLGEPDEMASGEGNEDEGAEDVDDAESAVSRELSAKRVSAVAAARRIFLKQRGDPYNRETVVGFPLIGARVGRKKISGPLFYWSVDPQLQATANRLLLTRPSPSPALNSLLLSKFTEEDAQIDVVRDQLIPVVQADPFDLSSVETALRQIRTIFDPLKDLQEVTFDGAPLSSFLERVRQLSGQAPAIVVPIPVLVNSPRSFAFILDDLGQLTGDGHAGAGSVVTRFTGELPEEVEPEEAQGLPFYDTMDGGDPLWFPEESNDSQRRVGRKARRVRTLTVQGPPGTGKSQTIANVVCDLVADGKSVLVTSHTRKALEVLATKLPRIRHLAVPVLASDRESLAKLRSELEAVQESGDRDLNELQKAVERAEHALRDLDAELRHLDRRYSELRQMENEAFPRYRHLAEIREYDRIHPEDRPDQNDTNRIADALREYAEGLLEILPALQHFRSFFRPEGDGTTRAREARRHQALSDLLDLFRSVGVELSERSVGFAESFAAAHGAQESVERTLEEWADWIRAHGGEIREGLRWVEDRCQTSEDLVALLLRSGREIGDLATLEEEWDSHLSFFEESELTGEELGEPLSAVKRQEIAAATDRLREASGSFFAWHLTPSARRARKVLDETGLSLPGRKKAPARLAQIGRILNWQSRREDCRELAATYDSLLPQGVTEPISATATSRVLERQARDRLRILQLIRAVVEAPLREGAYPELEEFGLGLIRSLGEQRRDTLAAIPEDAARRLRELRVAQNLQDALNVSGQWERHKSQLLEAVRQRDRSAAEPRLVEQLEALAAHYAVFERVVDLATTVLSDMPKTLTRLEEAVRADREIPEWVVEAEVALEAHRLSGLLRQSLSANPDDLSAISERLAEGQRRRRELILRIVERRRELGVRKAVRSAKTNNALLNMRDLLGKKRMTKSFLSLRDQIDYRELLRVFPCWICNIDDVARLFPLEAGLFDYIVVDEASQCPQTALLPLTFRARRAVVVGDRKQLQPASARFLNQKAIDVIAERTGIAGHPVIEAFDGQKSLLDVAERFREEFDFLDEHFRCDPDIIRWSNARFYDNRLKILTHRRNRVYRPALEIRELEDADDDREEKRNRREAEAVLDEVRRLIDSGEAERMTIGVISPYRKQADLLNEMIEREFAGRPEMKRKMGLLASTADGFQGDERDIILYSFRYGPSSHPATIHAIEREAERLNVAFTRAKRKVICFVSHSLSRFPKGLIRSFLEHAREVEERGERAPRRPDHFDSEFEREVCYALRERGLTVSTQEPVAGYYIDLVVEDEKGRVLGIECDGEFKFNEFGELRPHDYQRQDVIERAGWTIHRISGRSWLANPEREAERVSDVLGSLPTAKEREVTTGPRVSIEEKPPEVVEEPEPPVGVEAVGEALERVTPEPVEEEPTEEEETVLREFGATADEQVVGVKRLWRWVLLKGRLEGSALDALSEIEDKLEAGRPLTDSELEFLEDLLYSAYRRGYNPDTAEDLPEQHRPLSEYELIAPEAEQPELTGDRAQKPWQDWDVSRLEREILDYLWESRPDGRDKYEISGHLVSECGFAPKKANTSRVNSFLYGSLSRWVERRGDRPPRWYLRNGGK